MCNDFWGDARPELQEGAVFDSLCVVNNINRRRDQRFIALDHHLYDQLSNSWLNQSSKPQPYMKLGVDVLVDDYKHFGFESLLTHPTRHADIITGLRDLSYDARLKECGLTTLETRRLRGDQIEVFKILNGHENIDPNIFFKIKTGKITRGHDFTLVKGQNRLDFRKYSFSQRTVNEWNKLSADCVHSSSVNMFKNRIDNYLVRAGYT